MPLSTSTNGSPLRRAIELDEVSGEFEYDADGYLRFTPSSEEKKRIERWLSEEIALAEEANRTRFDIQAENRETYSAVKKTLDNQGGVPMLPSPIASIPADQIIAATHNNIMRPVPIFALDPYFDEKYPVLQPSPEYDPADPETSALAGVPPGLAMQREVDAEDISRRMEAGLDFIARERLDFENVNHRVIDACVIEGYGWVKTCRKRKTRTIIKPKATSLLVDVQDEEEIEYASGSQIDWVFVHDSNMLRPNLTQDIDELEWLAERDPKTPDEIRAAYAKEEYFLFDDKKQKADEIEKLAMAVTSTVDAGKQRTDETIRHIPPSDAPEKFNDVREVWAFRWLRVKNKRTGESYPRRFMLQLFFHYGARKLMAAFRNSYNHQGRIHTVFQQTLDGSCTVGRVKYNQVIGTHLIQQEIRGAYTASHHQKWYDPNSDATAKFLANGFPLNSETPIPGTAGQDWGTERGASEHYSLLPLIEWNAGTAQLTTKVSDYETGASAPSHTSPNTVSMLLDRGGQTSLLFLSMMNRGWRRCVRLYLETARQFEPLGEVIPIRNPETKKITNVPFRYPIGEALDNFRIALTAANDAAARERNPDQIAATMGVYQQHIASIMQPIAALIAPDTTEEQANMYRKIIKGGQALLDRLIASTRADEDTFNILPEVDSVIAEKRALLAQAKLVPPEAMNAANPNPESGGLVSADQGAGDVGALAGIGTEPGMANGSTDVPIEGVPSPVPAEGPQ